jgi:hypothetical protein
VDNRSSEQCTHEFRPIDSSGGLACVHCNSRYRQELVPSETEVHCRDCCCARSWEALGITTYTSLSIPEHIRLLREQLDAEIKLRQENSND